MTDWLLDPRAELGETKSRAAERAERRGQRDAARTLYREAAEAFASVALRVPADHPNTRSDLAIAAIVCFARAGAFQEAVDLAERMLAQADALSAGGKAEIDRLAQEYGHMTKLSRFPTKRAGERGSWHRGAVRRQARGCA